ncbi:GntR family transcriptional regulator [Ktedonobacter sp. SOSP1-52]|uniref:aminotransferase-like domain-containing protein n=1 Tax=Ktedonobacter sp. SOSP1-52 TaxID=2778366 RepID=UPI001916A3AC|nr:PLP-dependent aminotransferase family protein [Ktedonobacter sp. SOSP1-52]GHO65840.1 GntR family transcriptional regulator [Ktedonobacter sp. SOSP1-52]
MQKTTSSISNNISFTRGVPALEALPTTLFSECLQAVLAGPDGKTVLQYGHNGGYVPLKQLLAEQYQVDIDQVLIGNGSLHLQDMLTAQLVQPGEVVFTEQPSYDRAIKTFRRRGAKVIGIPLALDGVDITALEEALARYTPRFMYIVPDFQNPAGVTTSREKRQALAQLAEKHGFYLVEDVPYRTLRYSGETLPLLRELNPERTITVSSYSKLISPGIRVGYLIGPRDIVKPLIALAEDTTLAPVLPTQAAVLEFHERGHFERNLENLKQLYAPRLQAMISAIKTYLPGIDFAEPEGGFFVSITLPQESNYQHLLQRAKEQELLLTDGNGFFADHLNAQVNQAHTGDRFVRLPFCALTPQEIEAGMQRLAELVRA